MINPIIMDYQKKNEFIQYNAALAITGVIRGTSQRKDRRWLRRRFYPQNHRLYELILRILNSYRNSGCYIPLYCRTDQFRNSFLPFSIIEWNKLGPDTRNLDFHAMFRKKLSTSIRLSEKSFYNIYGPQGSKLLNRLRPGFSNLRKRKFRYNFADTVNPLCSFALEAESRDHFFYAAKIMYHFAQPL